MHAVAGSPGAEFARVHPGGSGLRVARRACGASARKHPMSWTLRTFGLACLPTFDVCDSAEHGRVRDIDARRVGGGAGACVRTTRRYDDDDFLCIVVGGRACAERAGVATVARL